MNNDSDLLDDTIKTAFPDDQQRFVIVTLAMVYSDHITNLHNRIEALEKLIKEETK